MTQQWDELINRMIGMCSSADYLEFAHGDNEEDIAPEEMPDLYHEAVLIMLTSGIFAEVMSLPDDDLSSIADGLDRLWQVAIDERDTSALTENESEDDDYWLEELEALRDEADGMLAVLQAYASGDSAPDPNALIHRAAFLSASNLHQSRRLFGQAGAAILRGARYWPLWGAEIDLPPAAEWMGGLISLMAFLNVNGWHPLAPIGEQRQNLAGIISPDKLRLGPDVAEGEDSDEEILSPDEQRLMDILLCGDERLSDEQMAAAVPAFTPEIVQQLKYVLHGEEYADEDSPGEGWGPIHAARLLGKSGSPEAVGPLLIAVLQSDPDDILYSTALFALGDLGPVALPFLLDTMQYSTDLEFKTTIAEALGKAGRGDERAFRALEALYQETSWDDVRMLPMMALADQGDPRGAAMLYQSLKSDRDITPEAIREIVWALKEADPNHDPAELKRLEAKAYQRYDNRMVRFDKHGLAFCRDCGALMRKNQRGEWDHVEPEPAPSSIPSRPFSPAPQLGLPAIDSRFKNVGRNDPCPCGSGKKFKHCHGAAKPTVH